MLKKKKYEKVPTNFKNYSTVYFIAFRDF